MDGARMSESDFGGIDVEKLIKSTEAQMARVGEMQEKLSALVGRASDEDGLVTVESASEGLRELQLHPKAMRLSSGALAGLIRATVGAGAADLELGLNEVMGDLFGEDNPMRYADDPDA